MPGKATGTVVRAQLLVIAESDVTKISNALYDVRIAERCVDPRADSPWLVAVSDHAPARFKQQRAMPDLC